jgi:hypothetical protein
MGKKKPVVSTFTSFRLRIREFNLPPVEDALVLGTKAAIGAVAMHRALSLLNGSTWERIELEDDRISDILVRTNLLRRIPRASLIQLVLERVKPLINETEVLLLNIEAELVLEGQI